MRSFRPSFVANTIAIFDAHHTGEGHGPTSPAEAARTRRRNEAAYWAQEQLTTEETR